MTIQSQEYIAGYTLPPLLDSEEQKRVIRMWTMSHANDHLHIFGLLDNLQKSLGAPLFELNVFNFYFNPEDSNAVNKFLFYDNFQHSEFYSWGNQLGATLPLYGKPKAQFAPVLNPCTKMIRIDVEAFNDFFLRERNTHNNILKAVNNLYAVFGV